MLAAPLPQGARASSWLPRGFRSITVEPPPGHHPGHHPQHCSIPWGLHRWDSTSSTVRHRLLFLRVPKAVSCRPTAAARLVAGKEKGFARKLQGSAACSRARCHLGSPRWAPPQLLPHACGAIRQVTPPSSQVPHCHPIKIWINLIILINLIAAVFGFLPEKPTALLGDVHVLQICSSEDTREFSPVHVNMFSIVAFGDATSPFCFLTHSICFLYRTFIFY